MDTPVSFYGPVDELPAEGSDILEENPSTKPVDQFATALNESRIGFSLSRDGIMPLYNAHQAQVFQRVDIKASEDGEDASMNWANDAYEIDLGRMLGSSDPFQHLSDMAEPKDYVRHFLQTLASSLDDPEMKTSGRPYPVIRWKADESEQGATVQLLGLLVANDDQFQRFCSTENDDAFGLIFEDSEVDAHGIREIAMAVAVLGVAMAFTPRAEAGLFDKMKEKKQAKMEQMAREAAMRSVPAPIQQAQQSGWLDVHNDAYINYELLASAGENAERHIIVDINAQRAYLIVNNTIAVDTAVSTARAGKETPRGEFKITQRVRTGKKSTIYGCDLPYWMRLGDSAVGMHIGDLPGYPASAGCIRLPYSVAPVMFDNTSSGISIHVMDSWNPASLQAGQF